MSSDELVSAKKAVARISSGKQFNEDGWMTMWCNTNWGDLVQPAPLGLALLGSILVIASSTNDFSLDTTDTPAVTWEFARDPKSFKTCLYQLAGEGAEAFMIAHKNMMRIQQASGQIPSFISSVVSLIIQGSPQEVKGLLPRQISGAHSLARTCEEAASACEATFASISGLAQEMILACTHKIGTDQEKIDANKVHLEVLRIQKDQEALALQQSKENFEMVKRSFQQVETDFSDAVKDAPKGWDLIGMEVVETSTSSLVAAGNAVISASTVRKHAIQAGLGAFKNSSLGGGKEGAGQVSVPANPPRPLLMGSPPKITLLLFRIRVSYKHARLSVWPTLSTTSSAVAPMGVLIGTGFGETAVLASSGGEFVKASLESIKKRLDPAKPISVILGVHINDAIQIITSLIDTAKSAGAAPDALDAQKPKVEKLVSGLQQLVTSTNLLLQQTGSPPAGLVSPAAPQGTITPNAGKIAIASEKFVVDQMRENLRASHEAFDKASERLSEGQNAITKIISGMTAISLSDASLKELLPVLQKAVGAFTSMRAQFSQLSQLFHGVASLLVDVMGPSVDRWANNMDSSVELGGVSIGGMMLDFAGSDGDLGNPAFKAKLQKTQGMLQESSTAAIQGITSQVNDEQKKFSGAIDQRLHNIGESVRDVPAIAAPVAENIKIIIAAHLEDFGAAQAAQSKNNAMFGADGAM
ncbi:hypothetical protein FRC01_013622 [Tulasnella sp. 417]|nr:hypothetical protein FRC01_013622 [Tulasnella sp. 417]